MKESGIKEIVHLFRIARRKRIWKKKHPYSDTIPINYFDFNHVEIGTGSYGELNIVDFGGDKKLIIKNYVSIAQGVTFILNAEHHTNYISTYPFKVKELRLTDTESFGKGNIIIDDDVWIGYGATIMSEVHIGQGAIVAAGSIVTKDVPPYAIVAGNPAKVIKYRFSVDLINELVKVDYSKLTKDMIKEHISELYSDLKYVKQIEWMPRK